MASEGAADEAEQTTETLFQVIYTSRSTQQLSLASTIAVRF
jgi:hypothetical protein